MKTRGRPTEWTLDRLFDCAAACRTYKQFYERFPLAYKAAHSRDLLGVLMAHCGWDKVNGHVVDDVILTSEGLHDVMNEDGCLLMQAIDDPMWPMETTPAPLQAEIV